MYLGTKGNDFILNGKLRDLNAEEVYRPLTSPVFGSDVVYDCPNSKLMEQKKFIKFGLTQNALESHVQLIEKEVLNYLKTSPRFKGNSGVLDAPAAMAELTIFTAGSALQGKEVRRKLTAEFVDLFHDLEGGFTPINFIMPWASLPRNRKRDIAHARMREVYMEIIDERRKNPDTQTPDMIWNLMHCTYKDGNPVPDKEIAHMMITLLMAGQHSSSTISAWALLRLASQPRILEELYQEQIKNLKRNSTGHFGPLQYSDLDLLPFNQSVIKETLRVHLPIHSIMRRVKNPISVPDTPYIIPTSHNLLASPGATALSEEYFPNANVWDPHRWESHQPDKDEEGGDLVDYGYGAVSKRTGSPYLPFGGGRHRCIGEKSAYVNLGVIVATLVRNLKLYNVDGRTGVPETDYSSMFLGPVQPAVVGWERRFSDA